MIPFLPLVAGLGLPLWLPIVTIVTALTGAWLALGALRSEAPEEVRFEVRRIRATSAREQSQAPPTKPRKLLDETIPRPGASLLSVRGSPAEGRSARSGIASSQVGAAGGSPPGSHDEESPVLKP